mgnify:FL=1
MNGWIRQSMPVRGLLAATMALALLVRIIVPVGYMPTGRLAAPALEPEDRMPATIKAMIAAIALLFPLVGASLVVIYAGRWMRGLTVKPA